jgi:hypothetical protein
VRNRGGMTAREMAVHKGGRETVLRILNDSHQVSLAAPPPSLSPVSVRKAKKVKGTSQPRSPRLSPRTGHTNGSKRKPLRVKASRATAAPAPAADPKKERLAAIHTKAAAARTKSANAATPWQPKPPGLSSRSILPVREANQYTFCSLGGGDMPVILPVMCRTRVGHAPRRRQNCLRESKR